MGAEEFLRMIPYALMIFWRKNRADTVVDGLSNKNWAFGIR